MIDPFKLARVLWPDVYFYREQRQIIESVCQDDETFVTAGNKLGKDFIAAFIALYFFLSRHPVRVITTSTKDEHLDVLWGELGRFIQTSKFPLDSKKGGPLIVNHHEITKVVSGQRCPISYMKGMVASNDSIQSFQGHHVTPTPGTPESFDGLPRTLVIGDEATSLKDNVYKMVRPWASRQLYIGNPWPTENFFKRAIKGVKGTTDRGGDVPRDSGLGFHRRVFKIRAQDSPNVRLAEAEIAAGKQPSGRILVPGVKSWSEYCKDRKLWDKIQQCVSLDADWYEGADIMLFPSAWLDLAEAVAAKLAASRRAKTMGVDSAMGGDNTSWAISDDLGLIHLESKKTPDTSIIPGHTVMLMRKFGLDPESVFFDYGGGGKPHVDRLRAMGYNVNAVMFGVAVTPDKRRVLATIEQRTREEETRYAYKNRRAQMYGMLRLRLDPNENPKGFGLPSRLLNAPRLDQGPSLRGQLAPIPLWYDDEGRLYLPSKQRKPDQGDTSSKVTMIDLIGCSPDEADAVVLSIYGLDKKSYVATAGAV